MSIVTIALIVGTVVNVSIVAAVATVLIRDRIATARTYRTTAPAMSPADAEVARRVALDESGRADAAILGFGADAWDDARPCALAHDTDACDAACDVLATMDALPGPVLADALAEARVWMDEWSVGCLPADETPDVDAMRLVAAHYPGGIRGLVSDALTDGARIVYGPAVVSA